jgi:glucose/arabinose dehydrogenase
MRSVALITLLVAAAGGATSFVTDAAVRRAHVTAAECRGPTGQRTVVMRETLARAKKPLFRLRRVARRLDQPLYLASTPAEPSRLYVAEKLGRIRIIEGGRILAQPFLDLRAGVRAENEEGLLSLVFHPRYRANHLVYVAFNDRAGDLNLVEYRTNGSRVLTESARHVFFVDRPEGITWHNGGQLQFGRDRKLYFSTGDSANTPTSDSPVPITDPENHAQDLGTRYGKLFRIDVDAPAPAVETVAYGLRNPWRFSLDTATGALYIGDVGTNQREEVNILRDPTAGLYNFGWSACEGARPMIDSAADPNVRRPRSLLGPGTVLPPLIEYAHARSSGYCAARGTVIGGYVYRGARIRALRGRYLFGDYCSGEIWSASVRSGRASGIRLEHPGTGVGQLTSFGVDARGELYVTLFGGAVFQLVSPSGPPRQ